MPRKQCFLMGSLQRKWPLVQTSQGWKGKGKKGEKGRPLAFLFSMLCNPHVKTVRAKVGCRLHRLVPISGYPMSFICAHHGNTAYVLP